MVINDHDRWIVLYFLTQDVKSVKPIFYEGKRKVLWILYQRTLVLKN
jgi:hypothetical protein